MENKRILNDAELMGVSGGKDSGKIVNNDNDKKKQGFAAPKCPYCGIDMDYAGNEDGAGDIVYVIWKCKSCGYTDKEEGHISPLHPVGPKLY